MDRVEGGRSGWRLAEARIAVYDANPDMQRTDPRGYENALFAAEFLAGLAGERERSGEILMDIIENRHDSLPPEAIERAIGNAGRHIRSRGSPEEVAATLDMTLEVAPPDLTTINGALRVVAAARQNAPDEFFASDERALNILADAWSDPDLQQSPHPKTHVGSHYASVLHDLGDHQTAAEIYFEVAETFTQHQADRDDHWPDRLGPNGEIDPFTIFGRSRLRAYRQAYVNAWDAGNLELAGMIAERQLAAEQDHPEAPWRHAEGNLEAVRQALSARERRTPAAPPE